LQDAGVITVCIKWMRAWLHHALGRIERRLGMGAGRQTDRVLPLVSYTRDGSVAFLTLETAQSLSPHAPGHPLPSEQAVILHDLAHAQQQARGSKGNDCWLQHPPRRSRRRPDGKGARAGGRQSKGRRGSTWHIALLSHMKGAGGAVRRPQGASPVGRGNSRWQGKGAQ
jgi:hypothetical protein